MGLGKTLQVISFLAALKEAGSNRLKDEDQENPPTFGGGPIRQFPRARDPKVKPYSTDSYRRSYYEGVKLKGLENYQIFTYQTTLHLRASKLDFWLTNIPDPSDGEQVISLLDRRSDK